MSKPEEVPEPKLPATSEIAKREIAGNVIRKAINIQDKKEDGSEVEVIKGLGSDKFLRDVWLQINGYEKNYLDGKWYQTSNPVMNAEGRRLLMASLQTITRADFSNFDEKQINVLVYEFWSTNFAQFQAYKEEFELDNRDISLLHNYFSIVPIVSLSNAKGAGHRNVVRGSLSENVLSKLTSGVQKTKGWLSKINPLGND